MHYAAYGLFLDDWRECSSGGLLKSEALEHIVDRADLLCPPCHCSRSHASDVFRHAHTSSRRRLTVAAFSFWIVEIMGCDGRMATVGVGARSVDIRAPRPIRGPGKCPWC